MTLGQRIFKYSNMANEQPHFPETRAATLPSRRWKFNSLFNTNPPPDTAVAAFAKIRDYKDYVEGLMDNVWGYVEWARGHITNLERQLSE